MDDQEMSRIIASTNEKIRIAKQEEEKKQEAEREREKFEKFALYTHNFDKYDLQNCVSKWSTPAKSSLKCFSMFYYYPTTCEFEANEEEWEVRNLIWNFKASPNRPVSENTIMVLHERATLRIVEKMKFCLLKFFDDCRINKLTLVCIPSSSAIVTNRRYKDFSSLICKDLKMENAFEHVHVIADGEAKHKGGTTIAKYQLDEDFFKDKFIILFDDVITSGDSMEQFKRKLERCGASVICGFSIGKTKHERQEVNPLDNIEKYICTEDVDVEIVNELSKTFLKDIDDDLPF